MTKAPAKLEGFHDSYIMPNSAPKTSSAFTPVALLLVAMASIQAGAALAKHLFPVVGSTGATALRLLFATAILCAVMRPWRLRMTAAAKRSVLVYGIALGGMNSMFYAALRTVPLGVVVAFSNAHAGTVRTPRRP